MPDYGIGMLEVASPLTFVLTVPFATMYTIHHAKDTALLGRASLECVALPSTYGKNNSI
jgi:hypothetical protein